MYLYHIITTTSKVIFIQFRSIEDTRFVENQRCLSWIQNWEDQTKDATTLPLKERNKMFLSVKTKFDVYSMIIGFQEYSDILFKMYPGATVCASSTNQDRLENFFGEQRAYNGQTTNPTILQTGTELYIPVMHSKKNNTRLKF